MSDFDKMCIEVRDLLKGKTEPFRINLKRVAACAGVSNTPSRKLLDMVSDILTLNSIVDVIGNWCVAEIEGLDVQFNPVVNTFQVESTLI